MADDGTFKVYVGTHTASGMVYVGMTRDVSKRWHAHLDDAKRGKRKRLSSAIRRHGPAAFTFEVVSTHDTRAAAVDAERREIEARQATHPTHGFNANRGERQGHGTVYVYSVTRKDTGQKYVGIARNVAVRWGAHQGRAAGGCRLPLHVDMRRLGAGAFDLTVLQDCPTRETAEAAEAEWIQRLKSHVNDGGYNKSVGHKTPEQRASEDELRALIREQARDDKTTRIDVTAAMELFLPTAPRGRGKRKVEDWQNEQALYFSGKNNGPEYMPPVSEAS